MSNQLILLVSQDPNLLPDDNVIHIADVDSARRALGLYSFDRIVVDPDLPDAAAFQAWLDSQQAARPAPIVDEVVLATFTGGDRSLEALVLPAFIESSHTQLELLSEAHGSGDWEAVSRIAHSLKGQCAYVGAKALSDLFRLVEEHPRKAGEHLCEVRRLSAETNRQLACRLAS